MSLETKFLTTVMNGMTSHAFMLLLGLDTCQAMSTGASNEQSFTLDLNPRKFNAIGKAIGIAFRAAGIDGSDQVALKRAQQALLDGISDFTGKPDKEFEEFAQLAFGIASAEFMVFETMQAQQAEPPPEPKPNLLLRSDKLVLPAGFKA